MSLLPDTFKRTNQICLASLALVKTALVTGELPTSSDRDPPLLTRTQGSKSEIILSANNFFM